jgi:hypothetical protein
VPKAIRFDNLAPTVKKDLPNGERELTEEFQNYTPVWDEDRFIKVAGGVLSLGIFEYYGKIL